jgi:hypothetical protein
MLALPPRCRTLIPLAADLGPIRLVLARLALDRPAPRRTPAVVQQEETSVVQGTRRHARTDRNVDA